MDYVNMIQMIEMQVQDEAWFPDTQTDLGFTVERTGLRIMNYENEQLLRSVSYEFSYDNHKHIR